MDARGRHIIWKEIIPSVFGFEGTILSIILDSSMVQHSAVNRVVVGSSPTRGVKCQGMACRENPQTLMFTDFFVDKNILERDKMVHMAAKGSM